jgi:hypothetical protein
MENTIFKSTDKTVFVRGKVLNSNTINLPKDWHKTIDVESITVLLTPIGAHQDIIVKRCDAKQVHLQVNGALPIHCYYQVFAELKEG